MMDLLNELRSRKDREVRAALEQQEIQKALKEIQRDKASALERDKRRELERIAAEREHLRYKEEGLMDEITGLEKKFYEEEQNVQNHRNRLQNKVNDSEYLTQGMRHKEIDLARDRGEQLAKLKHQKEMLEQDRQNIMDDLENCKNGDISKLRKNEASRWAANDILSKGNNLDFRNLKLSESMKNKLVSGQARINKLKEEREKMQKEAFPVIDELDILEKQFQDKDFNQKARIVSDDLDLRNVRPDIKANQMQHMRQVLERNGPPDNFDLESSKNDLQQKIHALKQNYMEDDNMNPELKHGLDELQSAIKTAGGGGGPNLTLPPIGQIPGMGLPPLGPGMPPFPGGIPPQLGGFPGMYPGGGPFGNPMGNPLHGQMNPNLQYMKSQIDNQEEENKQLQEQLTSGGK